MKKLLSLITIIAALGSAPLLTGQQEEAQEPSVQTSQAVLIHTDSGFTISIQENNGVPVQLSSIELLKKYTATVALPILIGMAAGVLCKKIDTTFEFNPLLLLLATWPLTASLRIALVDELLRDIGGGDITYNKALAQTINSIAAWVGWIAA